MSFSLVLCAARGCLDQRRRNPLLECQLTRGYTISSVPGHLSVQLSAAPGLAYRPICRGGTGRRLGAGSRPVMVQDHFRAAMSRLN